MLLNGLLTLGLSAMATSRAKIMFDALDGLTQALEQMPSAWEHPTLAKTLDSKQAVEISTTDR